MSKELLTLLSGTAEEAARALLGWELVRELGGETVRVRIVETEAYNESDAASHTYKGKTPRNSVMFGPPGHLYVYFTYGMHYCCNVVIGPEGSGAAVLLRAVEPINGEQILSANRRGLRGVVLTNGPAKLCQALGIDKRLNGHDLTCPPLQLVPASQPVLAADIAQTTRIGIRRDTHRLWRFYERDNPYVSVR